jgi:hypothetical protein
VAEIVDLAARRARSGAVAEVAEAELAVERALYDVLMSIHSDSDSRAAIYGMAQSLADRGISTELFAHVAQMVINRMIELREPDGAA